MKHVCSITGGRTDPIIMKKSNSFLLFRSPIAPLTIAIFLGGMSAHAATSITPSNIVSKAVEGGDFAGASQSYTISDTVNSPLLVVSIASEGGGTSVSGVTFGSANLTPAVQLSTPDGSNGGYAGLWYLTNPTTNTMASVTVTGGTSNVAGFSIFTLSNVNQLNPIGDTDSFGSDAGGNPSTNSITAISSDSFLVSAIMSGRSQKDYAFATPTDEFSDLSVGGSTVHLLNAGVDGGALGNTTSLQFDQSADPLRSVQVSAEFRQAAGIPEPSVALLSVFALGGFFLRRRTA